MTAKQYLRQIKQMETAISVMESELLRIRSKVESPTGPKYTAARVQYSTGDALENGVVKLAMLESKLSEQIDKYEETRQRIVGEILSLQKPAYVKILYSIYVEGLPIWKTGQRMHYSRSQIKRIHGAALKMFYDTVLSI